MMGNELRDYRCANCDSLIGQIRVGSRIRTGVIMLCRACQEYDVPGGGECQMQEGLADNGLFNWIREGLKRERG